MTLDALKKELGEEATAELESLVEEKVEQRVEEKIEEEREQRQQLENEIEDVQEEKQILEQRVDLLTDDVDQSNQSIAELQSRELEKNAHLRWENVEPAINAETLEVAEGRVERFQKEDGSFARLPGAKDTLQRGGSTTLANSDLLPIQQLARMDEDMIRANVNTVQARLAIKVWKEREKDEYGLWRSGSGQVREFFYASDLKGFIRAEEEGITNDYAKKLTSRTIDAFLELTKNRLGVKKKNRRKDGLRYKERRVVLFDDAEIPGEASKRGEDGPGTADVHGD